MVGVVDSAYQPGEPHRGIVLLETAQYSVLSETLNQPTRTFFELDSQLVFELFTLEDLTKLTETSTAGPTD